MRVVFSKPQNYPGFNDGDFRDGGSAFQHMRPETAKAREPNVTVLVRGKCDDLREQKTVFILVEICSRYLVVLTVHTSTASDCNCPCLNMQAILSIRFTGGPSLLY